MLKTKFNSLIFNNYSVAIIGVFLFGLLLYKSSVSSFTYDESSTFLYGVQDSFDSLLLFKYVSANNHFLNTLLMKICAVIFGDSELVLRLPNLAALLLYLYYGFLIIKQIESRLIFPLFIILISNPFMLDFFSLARGYGLVLGFTISSTYYIINYLARHEKSFLWKGLLFASLGVLSNFSFIYFYIALLVIVFIEYFIKRNQTFKDIIKPTAFISIPLFVLIIYPIVKLISINQLHHGGDIGFWQDTITTLAKYSLYGAKYEFVTINFLNITILCIVLMSCLLAIYLQLKKSNKIILLTSYLTFGVVVFLLIVIGTTLNHYLFSIKYLIGRTAIFIIPVFMLCLVGSIAVIYNKLKVIGLLLAYTISAMLAYHTFQSFDLNSYYLWQYDMNTKKMIIDLDTNIRQRNQLNKYTFSVSWLYPSTISFYRNVKNITYFDEIKRKGDVEINDFKDADYFYLTDDDLKLLDGLSYELLKKYDKTNTYLIKKLH